MAYNSFSQHHDFTRSQIQDLVQATDRENPASSLVLRRTTGHRDLADRQLVASHVAFFLTVIGIFWAEMMYTPSLSRGVLYQWLLVAILSWTLRHSLYAKTFRVTAGEMARSKILRFLPLCALVVAAAFWIWTVHLVIGPRITLAVFAVIFGFCMMTIPLVGMWLTVPVGATFLLIALWGSLSVRLWQMGTVPLPIVISMDVGVLVMIGLYLQVTVFQLKPLLARSDKVDLLLNELQISNAELDRLRQEASSTLERRSSFFAGASHDFRQRLHGLKLLVYTAMSSNRPNVGMEKSEAALGRLSFEVESLEHYITEILDFARMETLMQKPQLIVVNLQTLFQKLDVQFEALAENRSMEIRFRPTNLRIITDPAMLIRMLENLISNALKYGRSTILVAARRRGHSVVIEVWDNGQGIAGEDIKRIFEAFFQHEKQRTSSAEGVGLGLAVVQRLSQALGYPVTVASVQGRGSVFRISIPAPEYANFHPGMSAFNSQSQAVAS